MATNKKKIIEVGFDMVDNTTLAAHIDEMEQQPFDGTVMMIRHDASRTGKLENVFEDEVWKPKWFRVVVDQITAVEFTRFTDNFLRLMAVTSSETDWFDDEGWANIVEHWRLAAWTARQSGLKGIAFDPEGYTTDRWREFSQFSYLVQPQRDRYSFAEYYDKARQRGQEVLEAIVVEYPAITLFCFFMNSVLRRTTGHANPQFASRAILEYSAYTLYPAFINGWLDVAPPTVTFVDGCEGAYTFNSQQEYLEADLDIRKACQELVAPENRDRYKAQVQVSFGVYLDAYWNPSSSPYYIDGLDESRVERLRANVATALHVADEYVWIYGEKFCWWPTDTERKWSTWPDVIAGCDQILHFLGDPIGYAHEYIHELKESSEFPLHNLLQGRNASFDSEIGSNPRVNWSPWQYREVEPGDPPLLEGSCTWDPEEGHTSAGSARIAGVTQGCVRQHIRVRSGERYAIQAYCLIQGAGLPYVRIRWTDSEGIDTHLVPHDIFIFCSETEDDWTELFGVVKVPEGAEIMSIQLSVNYQTAAEDIVWYDDVGLCLLP